MWHSNFPWWSTWYRNSCWSSSYKCLKDSKKGYENYVKSLKGRLENSENEEVSNKYTSSIKVTEEKIEKADHELENKNLEYKLLQTKIEEVQNPNSDVIEALIIGETFIKPKMEYTYSFSIPTYIANWVVDKKYPVIIEQITPTEIKLKWNTTYSG